MNYHYIIWMAIGLGIITGVMAIAIAIYAFFEKN